MKPNQETHLLRVKPAPWPDPIAAPIAAPSLLLVTTAAREAAWHRRERATRQEDRLFVRLAKATSNLQAHHGSDPGWLGGSRAWHSGMGYPAWGGYHTSYKTPHGHHTSYKTSDGSFWVCRGKGSCGYQWNWWDKDRCYRCSMVWAGITPGAKEPAAKGEAADSWAAHTAVAAVAASVRASAATTGAAATNADAAWPEDAPTAGQDDSDDIEGMEKIVEQLRGFGFAEGSPIHDELSKKVEESRARRIAARPLWAQERDLRGKITRKQQQIAKLREKSEAAKESARASLQEAEALDQKVVEAATEVGVLQRQLAEVARGVLLAAPCLGDASRLPPELQKLPKGLFDRPEWQAKPKACEDGLAGLAQQAQEAAGALEQQASEATNRAAAAAAEAVAGLAAAGQQDGDEDMPEMGEQEVVDALGDLLPGSAGGGEDDEGAFAAKRQETAKRLLRLMAGWTVSARKPRKLIGKKEGG